MSAQPNYNGAEPALRLIESNESQQVEDIGYCLIIDEHPDILSIESLVRVPLSYAQGLGKSAVNLFNFHFAKAKEVTWPEPDRRTLPYSDHERPVLVTEPHPEYTDPNSEASNEVLLVGLGELDIGHSVNLHKAMARQHPDRRMITFPTSGLSLKGPTHDYQEAVKRSLELTAEENLALLPRLTEGGQIQIDGTSLGSYLAMLCADINMSANPSATLNIKSLKLISPAVGAKNVDEHERFSPFDVSDQDYINALTNSFFRHMTLNALQTALRHPRETGECVSGLVAYALEPHKLKPRLGVVKGNLKGVQNGIEWSTIKKVAADHDIHVLGGDQDPLVLAQLPQWLAVKPRAKNLNIRILQNRGHALSIDAEGTARHLAEMEEDVVF